jgi:hypothetical protein
MAVTPPSNHTDATGAMPQPVCLKTLRLMTPTVGIILGIIHTRFIHIHELLTVIPVQLC